MALTPTDRTDLSRNLHRDAVEEAGITRSREILEEDETCNALRCHEVAHRALQVPLCDESLRSPSEILSEYAIEHQRFFNQWERYFERFWQHHRADILVDEGQGMTPPQDMVEEYAKANAEFINRWTLGVQRVVQEAGDESTEVFAQKILQEARVRERIFNKWLIQDSRQ